MMALMAQHSQALFIVLLFSALSKSNTYMLNKYPLSTSMQQFVERCRSYFPDSVIDDSIAQQRCAYNAMTASFSRAAATSLFIEDLHLSDVKVRKFQPKSDADTTILYAHGGGWYLGNLDSHASFCAQLAQHAQVCVISIDYRLSPEHPFPAALDDCYSVYKALLQQGKTPLLLGDSAGANLIAALTLRCKDDLLKTALAQILIYPLLALPRSLPSHLSLSDAPLLSIEAIELSLENYSPAGDQAKQRKYMFPLQEKSLCALPQAAIFSAQFDPLIDDARIYSQRLQENRVVVDYQEIKGLVHGAIHAIGINAEADTLFQSICDSIRRFKKTNGNEDQHVAGK